MKRRDCLATVGIGTVTALAGCVSGIESGNGNGAPGSSTNSRDEDGTEGGNSGSITADDTDPDFASATLEIRWNGAIYETFQIDPSTDQYYIPPDGKQYFVFQAAITNTGKETITFLPSQLAVTAGNGEGKRTVLESGRKLTADLEPDQRIENWVAFTIPDGASEVTITIDSSVIDYAADFIYDGGMELDVVPE